MKIDLLQRIATLGIMVALAAIATGCGQQVDESQSTPVSQVAGDDDGHNHLGWWCTEHGIPEEECSMCSSAAAAKCKENGDWCEIHNRAASQCFECDPSRAEKFAKLYEAKFGEAPPPRTE